MVLPTKARHRKRERGHPANENFSKLFPAADAPLPNINASTIVLSKGFDPKKGAWGVLLLKVAITILQESVCLVLT